MQQGAVLAAAEPEPDPRALLAGQEVVDRLVRATQGWHVGALEVLHAQVRGVPAAHAGAACKGLEAALPRHTPAPAPLH